MEQLFCVEADSIIPEVESALFRPDVSKLGTNPIKYLNIDVLCLDTVML